MLRINKINIDRSNCTKAYAIEFQSQAPIMHPYCVWFEENIWIYK